MVNNTSATVGGERTYTAILAIPLSLKEKSEIAGRVANRASDSHNITFSLRVRGTAKTSSTNGKTRKVG